MSKYLKIGLIALPVLALSAIGATTFAGSRFSAMDITAVGGQSALSGSVTLATNSPTTVNIEGTYTNSVWRRTGNVNQAKVSIMDNGVVVYGPTEKGMFPADRNSAYFSVPWTATPGTHEIVVSITAGGNAGAMDTVIVNVGQ